eukprot:3273992-Pleurochrysis_carterae.AAC.1
MNARGVHARPRIDGAQMQPREHARLRTDGWRRERGKWRESRSRGMRRPERQSILRRSAPPLAASRVLSTARRARLVCLCTAWRHCLNAAGAAAQERLRAAQAARAAHGTRRVTPRDHTSALLSKLQDHTESAFSQSSLLSVARVGVRNRARIGARRCNDHALSQFHPLRIALGSRQTRLSGESDGECANSIG